jgi:predicted component of viral defense system (DUF524 family)
MGREATLQVLDPQGKPVGTLTIYLRPREKDESILQDVQQDPGRDPTLEPVQIMEGAEYRYQFSIHGAGPIDTDRPEIFLPDKVEGCEGSLRPGLSTGSLPVSVTLDGKPLGRFALEVRSRKLDYISHYRWMLQDIAEKFAEAVMERFAPTEQRFRLDESQDAETLYQRFVFLKTLISGEEFETAVNHVLSRPHRAWVEEEELRSPGRGMPASSAVARQIASAPGPRIPWEDGLTSHLPAMLRVRRTEETLDTPENRFVRFALTRWRDVAAEIGRLLAQEKEAGPMARGRREVAAVVERLDALLSADLFQEVGPMTIFPAGSQVLQKRAGYRDLFRAYVQFEAAAVLTWEGGADVYSAGQRNVATLYEYWVFLQLAKVTGAICNEGFMEKNLFKTRSDGMGIALKQGHQLLLTGVASRHGRRMRLELWFNRSFGHAKGGPSWTVPMRPDCSLRIRPEKGEPVPFEEIWLHFDAKYRIEKLQEIFGDGAANRAEEERLLAEEQEAEAIGTAKRSDLLKMHAYRDAIRRSAGAYVVYPGSDRREFPLYHEILPGLGAFAMRPTQGGDAEGLGLLREFLEHVIDHTASQATQHERERWWVRRIYDEGLRTKGPVSVAPFVTRPPADTPVLLGYVRSPEQLAWIRYNRLYNMRADGRAGNILPGARELAVELVVLYGAGLPGVEIWRVKGGPEVVTGTGMQDLGYPNPRGELYHCLLLEPIPPEQWPKGLTRERVQAIRDRIGSEAPYGEPVAVTWLDLVRLLPSV